MLKGVNDKPEHARQLLDLLDGIEAKVNLIVFNPHEGMLFLTASCELDRSENHTSRRSMHIDGHLIAGTIYKASDAADVELFRHILIQGGRVCTIRDSRGSSEMAACGQLGNPDV